MGHGFLMVHGSSLIKRMTQIFLFYPCNPSHPCHLCTIDLCVFSVKSVPSVSTCTALRMQCR